MAKMSKVDVLSPKGAIKGMADKLKSAQQIVIDLDKTVTSMDAFKRGQGTLTRLMTLSVEQGSVTQIIKINLRGDDPSGISIEDRIATIDKIIDLILDYGVKKIAVGHEEIQKKLKEI